MASDFAAPPTHLSQQDNMDTSSQEQSSFEQPTLNGDHPHTDDLIAQGSDNPPEAPAQSSILAADTAIDAKVTSAAAQPDIDPAGPTPVDHVASGIQPVADFLPKDASNLSHPTPPPDEPLTTGEASVDVEMANVEPGSQSIAEPETTIAEATEVIAPTEPSLVRPREDDGEDEPAAKRSKMDDAPEPVVADVETVRDVVADAPPPPLEPPADFTTTSVVEPVSEPGMDVSEVAVANPVVETAEVSISEPVVESPPVKPSVTEDAPPEPAATTPLATEVKVETSIPEPAQDIAPSDAPQAPADTAVVPPIIDTSADEKPAAPVPTSEVPSAPAAPQATQSSDDKPTFSTEPMTSVQKSSLVEKMKNLKKTKNSTAFLKPVDYVTLGIPPYPDIIKTPMDLSTMEGKLKDGQYGSVQEFVDDFRLIISNVRRFNGDAHAITQAGFAMEAYFNRMMQTVPTTDQTAPPKVEKKRSPSITREKPPRREARMAAAPSQPSAPAPAASVGTAAGAGGGAGAGAGATAVETYALQPDGTPQIRRQSSNRPARAIKPPQNREIPYAKPKRKERQLELRFCDHVLEEIRSPKYGQLNHVFLMPVDPVALNIPNYHQIIKNPMDLTTMSQKLRNGQYGTAAEFRKDFELIIKNCLTFNPMGNPVRDLGIQLQREFEGLWAEKSQWERKHAPSSNRASSASADDSGEEEEEEEDEEDDKAATIRALQKQLADMQNALSGMAGAPAVKTKKAKSTKNSNKKIGSVSAAPKSKASTKPAAKPKKARSVTYDEKQEISEAVGRMDEKQVTTLTDIITRNCAKYRDMEEMELEIDDLPNDVQLMLLDYVRKTFGNPNRKKARELSPDDAAALDDDDFEPERGNRGGKRKKHKPMGKQEQQETIDSIKTKLAQFSQAATSASESPTNDSFNAPGGGAQVDTSGDDESEESEEE